MIPNSSSNSTMNNTIITDTSNSNSSSGNCNNNNFIMETSMNHQPGNIVGVENSIYSKPSPSPSSTRESSGANIHSPSYIHQSFATTSNRMDSLPNAYSFTQQSSHHNNTLPPPSLPSLSQMTTSSPNQIYPQNTNNGNLGNSAVFQNPYLLGNNMANNTMMSPPSLSNDNNSREHPPPPPPSDFSYSSKQQQMFNQNTPTNNGNNNIPMMHTQMNQQHMRLSNMSQNMNYQQQPQPQQRIQNEDNLPSLQQFGLLFSQSLNIYPSNLPSSSNTAQYQQNSKPSQVTEKPLHQVYNDNRQKPPVNANKAKPLSVAPQNNQVHTSSILNQLVQSQQQEQNHSLKNRPSKILSPPTYNMGSYPNNPPTPSSIANQPKYSNQRPAIPQQEDASSYKSVSPTEKNSMVILPSNMVVCEGLLKLISHRIMETMLSFDEKTMKSDETKLRLQDEWNKLVNEYFVTGRKFEGMAQVLHTLFGMLTSEPDIEIVKETISPNYNKKGDHLLSIKFRANLRIVRLKICIFFLLFKLSVGTCFQPENGMEEFLETNSLVVDEKLFSTMTWEQFILEMDVIESKLRFKIDMITHEDNENSMDDGDDYCLNVKNNTMNALVLELVTEERLQASFNQLVLDRPSIERFKQSKSRSNSFRLRLSVQMSNYLTITKFGNSVISIDNYGQIETRSLTISPLFIERAERKNKVVVLELNRDFFVTPVRDKSDIDFVVELTKGDERKRVSVKNIYIDKITVEYFSGAQTVTVTRGQDVLCEDLEILSATGSIHSNLKKLTIGTPKSIEGDSPFSSNSTTPSPLCEESTASRSAKRALSTEDDMNSATSSTVSPTAPKRVKSTHTQNSSLVNIHQYVKGLRDKCGFSLLHIAAMNGFDLAIEFFNEAISMPVDMTDNYQYSPYHWSCFSGKISTAKLLISKGASTTRRNVHSATGMQIAEAKKHKNLIEELEQELAQHACSVLSDLYSNLSESDVTPTIFSIQNRSSSFDHLPHNLKIPQHKASKNFLNSSPRQQGENHSPRPKLIPAKKKKEKSSPTNSPFGGSKKSVRSNETSPVTSSPLAGSLSQKMELFIKPSRKKRTYISFFPKELCSSPYKYDILLRIPLNFTNQFNESHFTFHLMIQGSDRQWMAVPEQAVEIVKYLRTMFPLNFREIEWRLMYKVCSFHYGRKPFKLRVIYNTNLNPETAAPVPETFATNSEGKATLTDNSIVYESEEFYIVARKKKENDYFHNDLSNGDDVSSVTDQSPLTLDQSLNGLSPTSPDSPCGPGFHPNSVFPRSSSPLQSFTYVPPNENLISVGNQHTAPSQNSMSLPPNLINPMSHMISQTILPHQQPHPPHQTTQGLHREVNQQ